MSLDGLIARPDSSLDWLTDPPQITHEHITSDRPAIDWDTFLPANDHLVMGRGTYEKILTFDRWAYGNQRVVVLSRSLPADVDHRITVTRSIREAASLLSARQAENVYIDGGQTVQAFLAAGLVDEVTIGIAPVLIGTGIPLFGRVPADVHLRLRAAHASDGGMVHATYDVIGQRSGGSAVKTTPQPRG
jgi:dihydrofolate reductase